MCRSVLIDPQERRRIEMPETLVIQGIRDISWWMCWIRRFPWRSLLHRLVRRDLIAIFRGEGMYSPKVTAGTAAALAE